MIELEFPREAALLGRGYVSIIGMYSSMEDDDESGLEATPMEDSLLDFLHAFSEMVKIRDSCPLGDLGCPTLPHSSQIGSKGFIGSARHHSNVPEV